MHKHTASWNDVQVEDALRTLQCKVQPYFCNHKQLILLSIVGLDAELTQHERNKGRWG